MKKSELRQLIREIILESKTKQIEVEFYLEDDKEQEALNALTRYLQKKYKNYSIEYDSDPDYEYDFVLIIENVPTESLDNFKKELQLICKKFKLKWKGYNVG